MGEEEFARSLFPVGEMDKPVVRALAAEHDLITSDKKDSTGICFIGERRFKDFLEQYLPAQPGDIVTEDGTLLGKHAGLMYHTIGQRQGLGIGGIKGAGEQPWYVAEKDLDNNQLLVVQGKNHPKLFKQKMTCSQAHWINGEPAEKSFRCMAKTRYRQPDQACEVTILADGQLLVSFDEAQRAITPGQSAVFYQGDQCLGGAVIEQASN